MPSRSALGVPLLLSFALTAGCVGGRVECGSGASCAADASAPVCTTTGECEESVVIGTPTHVTTPIDYADVPPAGGPHNPCWTTYGVHSTEVVDENWVHNLEHGAVVFLYSCPSGCASEVAALAALVPGRPFAVVTSYSTMPPGFAVVSWGHRLVTPTLDVAAFTAFYMEHVDHGGESTSANPPASCNPAP